MLQHLLHKKYFFGSSNLRRPDTLLAKDFWAIMQQRFVGNLSVQLSININEFIVTDNNRAHDNEVLFCIRGHERRRRATVCFGDIILKSEP